MDDNQPMDVDLSATQLNAANAINIQLLKLSTSPPSSDIPHDDRLRNPQTSQPLTVLLSSSTKSLMTRRGTRIKKASSSVKSFPTPLLTPATKPSLPNVPYTNASDIPGVRLATRFASYQDWRVALLADINDGSRLRQLVLDYNKHVTLNPFQKHMDANNLDLSI
jgi:hypothetical protein